MKSIVESVLKSGLVDEETARLFEYHQMIPPGSADLAKGVNLQGKTKEELTKLANDLEVEVEKEHKIKEMTFDLDRMKWPTTVDLRDNNDRPLSTGVPAVTDRMGRFYFQLHEVKKGWLVPGFLVVTRVRNLDDGGSFKAILRPIFQAQELYIDEKPVCWQVTLGDPIHDDVVLVR